MNNLTKVQKKNKNKKANFPRNSFRSAPFWVFRCQFKQKMESRGIHMSEVELAERVKESWDKLSPVDRDKYKTEAKTIVVPASNKPRIIYNALGQDLNVVEAEKEKHKQMEEARKSEIKELVEQACSRGELDSLVFHFISTTSFYKGSEGIYPAEVALSKFSLKLGIIDDIQIRINPGELPLGASGKAIDGQKVHRFPLPPDCEGECDYMNILATMIKFLHPFDEMPILFTQTSNFENQSHLEEARMVVEKIFYESQEDSMISRVKVYPIEELFYYLQSTTVKIKNQLNGTTERPFSSIHYAANEFKTTDNRFQFSAKSCDFHLEKDVQPSCCLSKVLRYGYILCEWCAIGKRYELQEGKHFPDGYIPL